MSFFQSFGTFATNLLAGDEDQAYDDTQPYQQDQVHARFRALGPDRDPAWGMT